MASWIGVSTSHTEVEFGMVDKYSLVHTYRQDGSSQGSAQRKAGPAKLGPPMGSSGACMACHSCPHWTEMAGSFMTVITECGLPRKSAMTVHEGALCSRGRPRRG